jgi:predicted aconitase
VGHRPRTGEQVAWGESNAVAFVNSVLGARSNRYGDFLDICCAITARAPYSGLHISENRRATVLVDTTGLSGMLKNSGVFYPVLGAWLGRELGDAVAVIDAIPVTVGEDDLKALGAGAAATGAVGLFHIAGVTPEAPTVEAACQGLAPEKIIKLNAQMIRHTRDSLGQSAGMQIDCVAVGSPHYSYEQCMTLAKLSAQQRFSIPFYVCTNRQVMEQLEQHGYAGTLRQRGVVFVIDTCVVVTQILNGHAGVMMTDSAKFAHYGKGNTGYDTVFGALDDCVRSAVCGRLLREESLWV